MASLYGGYLTPQQVAQVAAQAGFTGANLVTAVAVSLAEDGSGYSLAHNTNGEDSRGLWQINVAPGAHPQLASLNLFDPLTNAQQAFTISSGGTNWNAWTTFTSGKYKLYLNQAALAVAAAGVGQVGSSIFQSTTSALGTPGPINIPSPANLASAIPNPGGDIASALNNLASQISTGVNNATAGITQLHDLISWLGQPNLWERIVLSLLGAIVLIVGLVLFALSFTHAKMPAVVPV